MSGKNIGAREIERAINSAREFRGLVGVDLAREVTSTQPVLWNEGPWNIKSGFTKSDGGKYKIVALDFGVKRNILRLLVSKGCSAQGKNDCDGCVGSFFIELVCVLFAKSLH